MRFPEGGLEWTDIRPPIYVEVNRAHGILQPRDQSGQQAGIGMSGDEKRKFQVLMREEALKSLMKF
jgi:hypothetical protein